MTAPLVTLVVAARNEAHHITACLDSIVAQTVGLTQLQVLVVDGRSTDRTREIVAAYIAEHGDSIQLLDNARRITPCAFNLGIKAATAPFVGFVSAHSTLAPDYVAECLEALARSGADDVGGPLLMTADGYIAQAIAMATASPFGVGNANWRYATEDTFVDTVFPGMYRREVFDRIGFFDEELVRNQDDELNFRLTQSGGKIFLSPRIKAHYVNRSSPGKLWRQYYQYGYWKVRVIQKRGGASSWRHFVPAAFVCAILITIWHGVLFDDHWWAMKGLFTAYGLGATLFAIRSARKDGWQYLPLLPLLFLCLHLSYGLGFLQGLRQFSRMVKRNSGLG
ncbi:MAG: glycosyltransferase family 2 protein [Candidatus Sericytochromatia bacterium]|nr:glycosyltransferase family 2 protein [Candidatus Sericytochromatia bacterium]